MAKQPKDPGPSQQEMALADVSSQQWNDYISRFRPAELALAKNAELTKGERAQVKGEVAADTAQAFKGLTRSTIAAGGAAGAQAGSGKTKLSIAADASAAGKAKGVGQSMAETGAEIDAQGRQLQIASFGRGVAQNVTANLSRGAQRATSLAIAASEAKFVRNATRMNLAGAVAGAASRKYQSVREERSRGRLNDLISEGSGISDMSVNIPPFDTSKLGTGPFDNTTSPFAEMYPDVLR